MGGVRRKQVIQRQLFTLFTSGLMPSHPASNSYFGKTTTQLLLLSTMSYGIKYHFGPLRSAVPAVSQSCSPVAYWLGEWSGKQTPWICASPVHPLNTGMLLRLVESQIQKTSTRLLWRKLTPPQPDSVQFFSLSCFSPVQQLSTTLPLARSLMVKHKIQHIAPLLATTKKTNSTPAKTSTCT